MKSNSEPTFNREFDDAALLLFFQNSLKSSESWFDDIWAEANRMWAAYAGETLSDRDKSYLRATGREPVDWNIALGTINMLLGTDQAERKEARFKGVDKNPHDQVVAEGYTRVNRHFMTRCHGPREETAALHDALVGGYGFNERYMDTSKLTMPLVAQHVPYWEMLPDPDAVKPCLIDSKFWIRRRTFTLDNAIARWPDKLSSLGEEDIGSLITTTPEMRTTDTFTRFNSMVNRTGDRKYVEIYDFQYFRYVPMVVYRDPVTGRRIEQTKEEFTERMNALDEMYRANADEQIAVAKAVKKGEQAQEDVSELQSQLESIRAESRKYDTRAIESYRFASKRYYRAFFAGALQGDSYTLLDHRELKEGAFTYSCVTAFQEKDGEEQRVRFFGPMEVLYSSQMSLNRSAVTIHETLGRGAKGGGGFVEHDALVGTAEDFAQNMAKPGAWQVVESGAIQNNKIKEMRSTPLPPGIAEYVNLLIEMVSRVTLVTDSLKGTMQTERSNVLISNMQQQSLTGLLPLYDSMSMFRVMNGKIFAAMIYHYVPIDDLNKICEDVEVDGTTHQDGQPIPGRSVGHMMKEMNPLDFDIVADQGPSSPTHKQAMWQILYQTNLLPQLLELLGPAATSLVPELLRYMPIDPGMAEKIGDQLEAGLQAQQQQQQPPQQGRE